MQKLVSFLVLSCLPWIMGCDEYVQTNASPAKAASEVTVPADQPKETKKPQSFSEFPTTDPLITHAIETRQLLIQQEEELLERLEGIRTLLASAKVDRAKLRQSVESFLQTAKDMRDITMKANESMNVLIENSHQLMRTTRHLGSSYRAASELFRKKAHDYSEKRLRDQLECFAKDFEDVAQSIPERQKSLQAFQKQLPQLRQKAREAQAFLDDVILYLASHPGIGSDPRTQYSEHFESFAVTFSDWLRTLEELRSGLRARAISKTIQESFRHEQLAKEKLEEAKRLELARLEQQRQAERARQEQATVAEQERAKQVELARQARIAHEQEQLAKDNAAEAKKQQKLA